MDRDAFPNGQVRRSGSSRTVGAYSRLAGGPWRYVGGDPRRREGHPTSAQYAKGTSPCQLTQTRGRAHDAERRYARAVTVRGVGAPDRTSPPTRQLRARVGGASSRWLPKRCASALRWACGSKGHGCRTCARCRCLLERPPSRQLRGRGSRCATARETSRLHTICICGPQLAATWFARDATFCAALSQLRRWTRGSRGRSRRARR